MAMVVPVPGPFVGVAVDSGLHLGRLRLLTVPMGIRLPAVAPLVAVPKMVRLPSVTGGAAGECPSRGRRSVRAAAAANGVSSAVLLPDSASSGAGLFFGSASAASSGAGFFFGSDASSVALAAGSRAPAGRTSVVVAATAVSPADDGGDDDDDDAAATPAEIEEEEQWIRDKEQWIKDGEKYILGWTAEEEKQIKNKKQWMKDGEKYIWDAWNADLGAQAQNGNRYIGWNPEGWGKELGLEWLLLPRLDEEEEVTATITTMFSKEHVLKLIRDFNPEDVVTDTFPVCKEKGLIDFFGEELMSFASVLDTSMMARPPSSESYEALATIGMELKIAVTECQRGYLQSESLDRALVAMKRLRAYLELPEDSLDIWVRLPQRPRREFAVDYTEQAMIYFILMAAYTHDVSNSLLIDMVERATDDLRCSSERFWSRYYP